MAGAPSLGFPSVHCTYVTHGFYLPHIVTGEAEAVIVFTVTAILTATNMNVEDIPKRGVDVPAALGANRSGMPMMDVFRHYVFSTR